MSKPRRGHREMAPFSAASDTELTSSKQVSHRSKRAEYTHGIVNGERVLIANAPRETEKGLMLRIRAALAVEPGVLIWRNNVGVDAGRGIRYGLGVGSADLVGLVMVRGLGVFLGVEVKTETGRVRPEQERWRRTVDRHGGIAIIARSPEDALEQLRRTRDALIVG